MVDGLKNMASKTKLYNSFPDLIRKSFKKVWIKDIKKVIIENGKITGFNLNVTFNNKKYSGEVPTGQMVHSKTDGYRISGYWLEKLKDKK